jgi:hypothetical protein
MAFLAENITTAGAKAGVQITCPKSLKFIGNVAPTSIQMSATDADYVTIGNVSNEGVFRITDEGDRYVRANVNHVTEATNFDIEILD